MGETVTVTTMTTLRCSNCNERLTPYEYAKKYEGVREWSNGGVNPIIGRWIRKALSWVTGDIDSNYAWCAIFVGRMVAETLGEQYIPKHYYRSRAWRDAPNWTMIEKPEDLEKGDLVVYFRGLPSSGKGHIHFFEEIIGEAIMGFGGNQNNEVNSSPYLKSRFLFGLRFKEQIDLKTFNFVERNFIEKLFLRS